MRDLLIILTVVLPLCALVGFYYWWLLRSFRGYSFPRYSGRERKLFGRYFLFSVGPGLEFLAQWKQRPGRGAFAFGWLTVSWQTEPRSCRTYRAQ